MRCFCLVSVARLPLATWWTHRGMLHMTVLVPTSGICNQKKKGPLSYPAAVWQHALHRWMVFGSKSSYWTSLGMTYLCYSVSIVLSSLFTDILVQQLHIHHQVAWILTLVATGLPSVCIHASACAHPLHPGILYSFMWSCVV